MPQGPAPHPPEHHHPNTTITTSFIPPERHHHHHLQRRGRGQLGAAMSHALARAFHTAVSPLGRGGACGWPPLSLSGGQAVVHGPVHDTRAARERERGGHDGPAGAEGGAARPGPAREPRALPPCLSASLRGLAVFTLGGILAAGPPRRYSESRRSRRPAGLCGLGAHGGVAQPVAWPAAGPPDTQLSMYEAIEATRSHRSR